MKRNRHHTESLGNSRGENETCFPRKKLTGPGAAACTVRVAKRIARFVSEVEPNRDLFSVNQALQYGHRDTSPCDPR